MTMSMPATRDALRSTWASGYVPGMNAVVMGAALAAGKLGWEMVGIRDGFEGLLHPDRYPDGGLVPSSPQLIENLDPAGGGFSAEPAPDRSVPRPRER